MPCRELRFVLSVVFYVVNENLQNRIRSKSCKKQKKTPETVGFQVLFWSCWADSNRRPHPYQWHFHHNEPLRNGLKSKELQGFSNFGL